jgi:hypothetical protein
MWRTLHDGNAILHISQLWAYVPLSPQQPNKQMMLGSYDNIPIPIIGDIGDGFLGN